MQKIVPILIHGISWLATLLTLLLTAFWISLLVHARANAGAVDGFGTLGFMIYAELFGAGTFLFAAIPSAILYFVRRQKRDLFGLCLAIASLSALGIEAVILFHLPHTGAC